MTEHELRRALRDAMATTEAPPPMSEVRVLEAAKQSQKHRRAAWAGAGSAVAVAAIAVAAVLVPGGGRDADHVPVGGNPAPSTTDTPSTTPTGSSSVVDSDYDPQWPNGQTDRTASSGARYEQGRTLEQLVEEIVPEGYATPTDLTAPEGFPLRSQQAQFRYYVNGDPNGDQVWEYSADLPVTKDGGTGKVFVTVITPGDDTFNGEGCALVAQQQVDCEDVTVDGEPVGLTDDPDEGQQAWYRHGDGTVVSVGQALVDWRSGLTPLAAMPFTQEQLATLAADPRFLLE